MEALKLLKEEQKRKRKELADRGIEKSKKFIKRSELEKMPDKEESKAETSPKRRRISSTDSMFSPTTSEESPIFNISRHEVVRRLRERDEPIRLFGETDNEACLRLRQIEILAPEINKGLRNDFKDALDRLDQEELDLLAKQGEDDSVDLRIKDDDTTLSDMAVLSSELGQGDIAKDQDIILKVFTFLLEDWARDLNARDIRAKRSTQGKLLSATHRQTKDYLEPLFKMLRKKTTMPDILTHLSSICLFLTQREYVKANDVYLQMSIGNAPWPIGVTMVGIHARTGREKIFAQSIAHVLNDETQRKYIQAVKRLMTFCQQKYETDPSKSVEYKGIIANSK